MPMFKLDMFPNVCRLCLEPASNRPLMVSLSSSDPELDDTIGGFITAITFEICKTKSHLVPQQVCYQCLELLKFFSKYRSKLMTVHLLIDSLAELKRSNSKPISDLFEQKDNRLTDLLRDLDLCNGKDATLQDLLDEFETYAIAAIDEKGVKNENETFEECTESTDTVEAFVPEALGSKQIDELLNVPKPKASVRKTGGTKLAKQLKCTKRLFKTFYQRSFESHHQMHPEQEKGENSVNETFEEGTESADTVEKFVPEELGSNQMDELLNVPKSKASVRKRGGTKLAKQLKCTKCLFKTFYQRSFDSHQQMHPEQDSVIRCQKAGCTEVFQLSDDYHKHCTNMHKQYICETCGYKCGSKTCLTEHQERHLKQYNHICPHCQRAFNGRNDVLNHIRITHYADDSFSCKTCGMEFKMKRTRDEHEKIHEDVYDYPCITCDKKFKSTKGLRRHCAQVHEQKRLICEYCNKSYPASAKLKDHIESTHGVQQRFICDICVKTLRTQEDLDAHKAYHANPGPLRCGTCLILFHSDDQMKAHLCITYRDDYICCGRDFRPAYFYNKHMFTKHGIKTNVRVKPIPGQLAGAVRAKRKRIESCPKCEVIFPTRTKKRQHMESCTGAGSSAASIVVVQQNESLQNATIR